MVEAPADAAAGFESDEDDEELDEEPESEDFEPESDFEPASDDDADEVDELLDFVVERESVR